MASPFLMLPPSEENSYYLSLYSLKEKKRYQLNLPPILPNFRCVGPSHGWLAFLDENDNSFLLNPFSTTRLDLPPKHTLPCIPSKSNPLFPSSNIHKLILSTTNPHAKKVVVIVMYSLGFRTKIAFCRLGDQEWRGLDCEGGTYYDVVCCDHTNTVFALGPGPSLESWDLSESIPKKKMVFQDFLEGARKNFPRDLFTSQWYLAFSFGQLFLVLRYIGEFVRYDGEVVREGDTLTDYAAEPLVCPYRTVHFHVFKLDGDQKKWNEVESVDDFAMFVGGNESTMLSTTEHPELERNAIYFTDDYWERIDEDYMYGGHDMGIFRIQHGSIEPILDIQDQKIEPPPFWIM